ncbi:MAG: isochorismatase family protein [Bacteroidales bacterium]|jgi:nicotinamidase-related amidase|nr:isochorismatase family protein [Bacteroidales bacterium]
MKKNLVVIFLYALLILIFKSANAQSENNPLSNKIVIVVHMQEQSTKDELLKETTTVAIKKINQVIEEAVPENIVYAKIAHKILNLTLKKIYVEKINTDLDSRLKIVNKNIFTDYNGDIFSSDELKEFLKGKNINEIVIVGRAVEECIKTSTLKGLKLGYEMYLVPDAIIGQSEESKSKAIHKLENKGAKILNI